MGSRAVICRDGFALQVGDRRSACRWDEIEQVREIVTQVYFPLNGPAKFIAPIGKSRRYVVTPRTGRALEFTGNTVRKVARLGKLIQAEAEKRSIPCITEEVMS
jgi:hypothetical protein